MITTEKAISLFKTQGGILKTREALRLGISPKTLYHMRDQGYIRAINRGVYYLINHTPATYIDLVSISKRIPKAIICLISALSYHQLTTQIPRNVYVAYQQSWRQPKIDYPPIKIFRYSKASFSAGIEYHMLNGIEVPIYSAAKTVVDCFKFRNKIGIDVAIEALKEYWHKNKHANVAEILKYAHICRVTKIIMPYLEIITHE